MRRGLGCLLFLFITACSAGSGKGLDASGRPIGEAPDPSDLPTLSNIQARVFTPICVACHVGANAPRGLHLDSANAFNELVNVASDEVPSILRVKPFDPDNSYLVQKIEGTASFGALMPFGGPPLPPEDILLIRQWISDGALNDAVAVRGATSVVSASVAGKTVTMSFSNELDVTTVHVGSVLLMQSTDRVFGNDDDRLALDYRVSVSPDNTRILRVELPSTGAAWYRLSLGSAAASAVLDSAGRPVHDYQLEVR